MKDAFSTVPISVAGYLKSEPESFQRGFERVRSIDEERRLLDLLFLAEFAQERCGALRNSRLKQSDMEEFVGSGIDSVIQPMSFVVDPSHRPVDGDLIRGTVASRP